MKNILAVMAFFLSNICFATVETGSSFIQKFDSGNQAERQYLLGYVAGVYDSYEKFDSSIYKCLGSSVRMSQITDALSIYIKNNPSLLKHGVGYFFQDAIREMYGCR